MQITLYFADYNATASGQRVFNIQINGQMIATAVDIYALGGGDYSAVSVAAPAFYSGSRSNFDVALPTVVGYAVLKLQLLLSQHAYCGRSRPSRHACYMVNAFRCLRLPFNRLPLLVCSPSADHHIMLPYVDFPFLGVRESVPLQSFPNTSQHAHSGGTAVQHQP